MTVSQSALFPSGTPTASDVEALLGAALAGAGEWPSPRHADGVSLVERRDGSDGAASVRGQVWTIDQQLHHFWLELATDVGGGADVTLHYDVEASSARRARDAFEAADRVDQLPWRVVLRVRVERRAGELVVVAAAS